MKIKFFLKKFSWHLKYFGVGISKIRKERQKEVKNVFKTCL